jgi:dipeptidyl-peptidase-3
MAPPTDRNISHLAIGNIFAKLTTREQLYAHHLSRASWHGTRIVLQQVSPEAEDIFDFILEVHRSLDGSWGSLATKCGIAASDIDAFIEYAAQFLCSLGNYLVRSQHTDSWRLLTV